MFLLFSTNRSEHDRITALVNTTVYCVLIRLQIECEKMRCEKIVITRLKYENKTTVKSRFFGHI